MNRPHGDPAFIVLYDGICVLCQFAVKWLIRIDSDAKLHFASLQGETAQRFGVSFDETTPPSAQTVMFVDNSRAEPAVLSRMAAVIGAVEATGRAKPLARLLKIVPTAISNRIYRLVAAIRYRAFGQYDRCPVPSPQVRARFLP